MRASPAEVPLAALCVVSVLAWGLFALVFRLLWVPGTEPGDGMGPWLVWMAVGMPVFVATAGLLLRLLRVPPGSWPLAAIALTAPALCCDVLTFTWFEAWYPGGGSADDRRYAALIVGGVGVVQLALVAAARTSLAGAPTAARD
jgi:hypothetical protein